MLACWACDNTCMKTEDLTLPEQNYHSSSDGTVMRDSSIERASFSCPLLISRCLHFQYQLSDGNNGGVPYVRTQL